MAVRISSPGTTSASQAVAADRALTATAPRATTIARPTTSAPTVVVVRAGSRAIAARASRSSRRSTPENGRPATRPERTQQRGRREDGPEQDDVDDDRSPGQRPRAGQPRHQERRQDADDGHHDEQPARVRTHAGRGVRAGPEGLDGADGAGATRRLERGHERDHDAGPDRGHEDLRRDLRPVERHAAGRAQPCGRDLREQHAGRRAQRRPEHAEQRALGDDDPHDLRRAWRRRRAAARARGRARSRSSRSC